MRARGAAVLLLTLLLADGPRLWAGLAAPAARGLYTGQLWGAYDLPQYVEAIREGAAGRLLYEGRVWSLPYGSGYLFQLPYLAGGLLAAPLHAGPFAVLEVMRWGAQAAALAALVLLVRAAVPAPVQPWALLFAAIGGGLGWLFLGRPGTPLGPVLPMDVTTPGFDLLNSFQPAPHVALMAAATALFAWGLLAVIAGRRRGFLALPAWALALTIHPFELAPLLVAAAGTIALAARSPRAALYVGAGIALAAAEAAYLGSLALRHDPAVAIQAAASASTEVGNLPSLLVSRAVVLPLAAAAAWPLVRGRQPVGVLLSLWALLALTANILTLDPAGPYHRTLEGSSAPLGCLAALAVPRLAGLARPAVLAAVLLSPVLQAAALVMTASATAEAWIPAPWTALAAGASAANLRGSVLGPAPPVRWVVALSDLREADDDPERAAARAAQAAAGSQPASGADYVLVLGAAPPGLTPAVSVPGAGLYR